MCSLLLLLLFAAIVYHDKVKQRGSPWEYAGNSDYILQHGAHIITANATHHTKTRCHPQYWKYITYCHQRRIESWP